jgi:acetylornithine/N-succinyldiaminopimelate aminotransferase
MNRTESAGASARQRDAETVFQAYERWLLPCYRRFPLVAVRGEGSYLWDACGKRYLDLASGIAVTTLGHASPELQRALQEQAGCLVHCSNLYYHPWAAELAEWLGRRIGPGKIFFCNSGAEANECLFKLARRYGHAEGRYEILCAWGSFHGRTLACISATGQQKVQDGFGPLVPGFAFGRLNDLDSFQAQVTEKTVAVLVEPIQGEGGVHPADPEFLLALRRFCTERRLLLFLDEVQTGCFRTGAFLGFQRILERHPKGSEFVPDGIALAKGLAGGFPMGAVWIHQAHAHLLGPSSHASTFGGNPLGCAAALTVLRTAEEERLAEGMRIFEQRVREGLKQCVGPGRKVQEIRGLGGLLGLALEGNAWQTALALMEAGLLTVPAAGEVLRLLPPLSIQEEEILEALQILSSVLS